MSTEKQGSAVITYENSIIPIAYDGACAASKVSDATIECALSEFEWKRGYLGFSFSQAISGKITVEGEPTDLVFTQQIQDPTTYRFADKLISRFEFEHSEQYRDMYNKVSGMQYHTYSKPETVVYELDGNVRFVENTDNNVFINKEGKKLGM